MMNTKVILTEGDDLTYSGCHASPTSDGELWVMESDDTIVQMFDPGEWSSVTITATSPRN